MPKTIRKYWGPLQGRATLNYNWSIINYNSVVIITASKYPAASTPPDPSPAPRFVGSASATVENVSPHGPPYDPNGNHGVGFVVNVDWNSPIPIVTDITVLDDLPVEVDY